MPRIRIRLLKSLRVWPIDLIKLGVKTIGRSSKETNLKLLEQRRGLRKEFVAAITISEVDSERQIPASTQNLSMQGCFVATANPFSKGTKLWITIVYAGVKLTTFGKVVYTNEKGMGVTFTKMQPRHADALERLMSILLVD